MRSRRSYFDDQSSVFGPARREPDRRDRLIPMINVVFLLLTFFLIAGTMRVNSELNIEPPSMATTGRVEAPDRVLFVDAEGTLQFQGRVLALDESVNAIKDSLGAEENGTLHIKADRETKASIILPLLQALSDSGVKSVRLITLKKEK